MDVMVDLETMATTADAAVISIGAVKFDLNSETIDNHGFYASVTVQSNLDYGRLINEDTMKWWMQQSEDARKVFIEPGKLGIDQALENFVDWIQDYHVDKTKAASVMMNRRVWSNGANFDEPILAHALTQCRQAIPWKFYNVRCVRTYKNLPGAKDITIPRVGVHHNALADAMTQAMLVQKIHKELFPLKMSRKDRE